MSGFNGAVEGGVLHGYDVVDNLTSTNTDKPLSANMGKTLEEHIQQSTASGAWTSIKDSSLATGQVMFNSVGRVGFIHATGISLSAAVTATAGQIPEGKRPLATFVVPLVNTNSTDGIGYVSINTNGSITLVNRGGTAHTNVYFEAVYPY